MPTIGPIGFGRGLNTKTTVFNSVSQQLTTLQNLRYVAGSLIERYCGTLFNGTQLVGDGANHSIQNITPNNISINSANGFPFLTIVDGKIYKLNNSGAATDITGATTFGAGVASSYSNGDILNGRIVLGDPTGAGAMATWNDTGNATMLTSPSANIVRSVNNFMFAVNTAAGFSSRVYYSNVGDPTSWNGSNSYVDFRVGDGDTVVDIHYIGTDLYIFKRRSIGRLSTITVDVAGATTLGPLTTAYVGIGAAGPGCVDKLPDGRLIFFGSDSHCYLFDGSSCVDISDQPDFGPNVQSLLYASAPALASNSSRCCVYPPRNEVWFINTIGPLTSGNPWDRVAIYNYQQNLWNYGTLTGTVTTNGNERGEYIKYIPSVGVNATFAAYGNFGLIGNLVTGYVGYLLIQDPATQGGNLGATIQWNASLVLEGEARKFIPRSLIMPVKSSVTNTGGASIYTISVGFDGGSFTSMKTVTPTTTYQRVQVTVNVPAAGFETMQIRVLSNAGAGAATIFEPFFMAGEYLI